MPGVVEHTKGLRINKIGLHMNSQRLRQHAQGLQESLLDWAGAERRIGHMPHPYARSYPPIDNSSKREKKISFKKAHECVKAALPGFIRQQSLRLINLWGALT